MSLSNVLPGKGALRPHSDGRRGDRSRYPKAGLAEGHQESRLAPFSVTAVKTGTEPGKSHLSAALSLLLCGCGVWLRRDRLAWGMPHHRADGEHRGGSQNPLPGGPGAMSACKESPGSQGEPGFPPRSWMGAEPNLVEIYTGKVTPDVRGA